MAFVLEREEFFDRADTYTGQHFLVDLEFSMPAFTTVSLVNTAIRIALFTADPLVQRDYLAYTLERDTEGLFFDRFRFRLFMVGELDQESSGTDLNDLVNAPGRYEIKHGLPVFIPSNAIGVIILIAPVLIRIAIALGFVALAWRLLKGGIWGALGGDKPSGPDLLMLAAIITLGVAGVILFKNQGKQRRLSSG